MMISDDEVEISTVEKDCLNESDCEIIESSNDEIVNTSQDDHEPSLNENESIEIIAESSSNDDEDEDDDDSNQLSGAECLIRCREFASITGTDNALAMFYLQNTKWDLEVKNCIERNYNFIYNCYLIIIRQALTNIFNKRSQQAPKWSHVLM